MREMKIKTFQISIHYPLPQNLLHPKIMNAFPLHPHDTHILRSKTIPSGSPVHNFYNLK